MYCPSCGNDITVELKYCSRCGANLSLSPTTYPTPIAAPVRLTVPSIVLGLTITIGLGIIFSTARELAQLQLHPAAITWMVLFGVATLFGCTALLLRFWTRIVTLNREVRQPVPALRSPVQFAGTEAQPHLPPRFEQVPSVTEHTTRTFSRPYLETTDPGTR